MRLPAVVALVIWSLVSTVANARGENDSPFVEGRIDGYPAAVIVLRSGGGSGASAAHVYIADGSAGEVGPMIVRARNGDKLRAFFHGRTLYFRNRTIRGGDGDVRTTHEAVWRVHFIAHRFFEDAAVIVRTPPAATLAALDAAVAELADAATAGRNR